MSNRPGICWKCEKREDCKEFNKNPDANVMECGRFKRKEHNKENDFAEVIRRYRKWLKK